MSTLQAAAQAAADLIQVSEAAVSPDPQFDPAQVRAVAEDMGQEEAAVTPWMMIRYFGQRLADIVADLLREEMRQGKDCLDLSLRHLNTRFSLHAWDYDLLNPNGMTMRSIARTEFLDLLRKVAALAPAGVTTSKRRRRKAVRSPRPLTAMEFEAIDLMAAHQGNRSKAARAAGVTRTAFTKRYQKAMAKLGKHASKQLKPTTEPLPSDRRGQATVSKDEE